MVLRERLKPNVGRSLEECFRRASPAPLPTLSDCHRYCNRIDGKALTATSGPSPNDPRVRSCLPGGASTVTH